MGSTRIAAMTPVPQNSKQLPLYEWAESKRAFPVTFGRSALFRVGDKRDKREILQKVEIATVEDYSLIFTGEELRISDEDVLLQLLHLARGQEASEEGFKVMFSSTKMLETLKWGTGAAAHERLRACIERLQNGSIVLKHLLGRSRSRDFYGSFISAAAREGNSRSSKWVVWLNKTSAKLLMPKAELDWPTRIELRSDLARWLQTYVESESLGKFQDHQIENLQRLTGSKSKELSNFKLSLKRALEELTTAKVILKYEWATPHIVRIHVNEQEDSMDP